MTKTAGVWSTKVHQPKTVSNYNKYMNALDRSDQILATNNVLRKCMRWWKTLFFHVMILQLWIVSFYSRSIRLKTLTMKPFTGQETIPWAVSGRRLCVNFATFLTMMSPPSSTKLKSARPLEDFEAVHMPEFSDTRTRCVVCYKQGGHELKVQSFCSAPQCMRYMHVTKEKNCFKEYHSREYQNS